MKIEIDDRYTGKKRRELIETLTIKYALEKFKSRIPAARFLGITKECLRHRIAKYDSLKRHRIQPSVKTRVINGQIVRINYENR